MAISYYIINTPTVVDFGPVFAGEHATTKIPKKKSLYNH